MKPNFALSLSFDGIRLLHRAAGGWRLVGEVGLDAADLSSDLAALRDKAEALAPEGIHAKVLLPNEQIKYLTIDAQSGDGAKGRDAAKAALEGATPYAVSDLAFDTSADGGQLHVAAVARETLEEAEGFAREHHFNPVSFAAVPGDNPFLGEPYFGESRAAADLLAEGEVVEPDGIAVVVIGEANLPEETKAAPPEPEVVDPTPPESEVGSTETADPPAEPDVATPAFKAAKHPAEQPEAGKEAVEPVPTPSVPAPETSVEKAPLTPEPSVGGFSSRRAPRKLRVPQKAPDAARTEPQLSAAAPPVNDAAPRVSVTAGAIDIEPDTPLETSRAPEQPAAPKSGFLSRRRPRKDAPERKAGNADKVIPAAAALAQEGSEEERMTIFGARQSHVGGKPRFLGLILTAALLVVLAGVAAWASVFLDEGRALSRLFGDRQPEIIAVKPGPADPEILPSEAQPGTEHAIDAPAPAEVITASLDPGLSDEDSAVLDALRAPIAPDAPTLTDEELAENYAVTGIWPVGPETPVPSALIELDDLYLTGIDPVSTATDAVALPTPPLVELAFAAPADPAAPGTLFNLDARGLVIPTAQGTLSPDGILVYLGRPPAVPPAVPTRFLSPPEDTAERTGLAAFRPRVRPETLSEDNERANLGGLTRNELAALRPVLRPRSLQEQAAAVAAAAASAISGTDDAVAAALEEPQPPNAFDSPTRLAAAASLRPDTRPRNFSRIVQRAQKQQQQAEVRVASAAAVAPRTVTPKIPSTASVAKQATVRNAINLRKVNLIGVYGKPSNRRALVRLANGRYRKVEVGDRLDGGRVAAIGNSELRYVKSGRNVTLKMPR